MKNKFRYLITASLISLGVIFSAVSNADAARLTGTVNKYPTSSASGWNVHKIKNTTGGSRSSFNPSRSWRKILMRSNNKAQAQIKQNGSLKGANYSGLTKAVAGSAIASRSIAKTNTTGSRSGAPPSQGPINPSLAPELIGYASSYWGSPCYDRCVNNVSEAFGKIRDHGDVSGYHMNGYEDSGFIHWQGVQRTNTGTPYLVVSHSSSSKGAFVVVKMGSRNTAGERFRSNRLAWDRDINNAAPSSQDRIVKGATRTTTSPATGEIYKHAGGIQLYGNILAVSLEDKSTDKIPNLSSEVVFYDMSNPENPDPLPYSVKRYGAPAGNVSLTRLIDGRYLLAVGANDAKPLDFYVSTTTDLYNTSTEFVYFYQWDPEKLRTTINDTNYGAYQNMQFVNQCDGKLYLIASHKNRWGGQDWIDLYLVENGLSESVKITKVGKKHVYCSYRSSNHCNLQASGGIYITPEGKIIFYSTEHGINGPGGSVKFEEFWPEGQCDSFNEAWVEIYEHNTYRGRSLLIDYADRYIRHYSNYKKVEGFGDKASSVKWCLPSGYSYKLYRDDSYRGSRLTLSGNGSVRSIKDLKSYNFNDTVSSSKY